MTGMRSEEAERFQEEDEDPGAAFATFEAAEKGRTATPNSGSQRRPAPSAAKIRHTVAGLLHRMANSIEPPGMRTR